jgi:hypothetical protein
MDCSNLNHPTIDEPIQKQGTVLKYTSYQVSSNTSNDATGSSSTTHQVHRRYRDFLWLHATLQEHNSGEVLVNEWVG